MGALGTTDSATFAARFAAAMSRLPVVDWEQRRLFVAYSGGIDSTVLLHSLRQLRPDAALTAVHFDHGLHPDSALWSAHCRTVTGALGVDLVERRLTLGLQAGASVEAVAREGRYGALAAIAGEGDLVLTAHHADDQLETLLLRLLRGTGLRGLTAIHACAPCGAGVLVRPLLEFTRAEIEAEARGLDLDWIEDPSNADLRFDRNYLRAECLPQLRARWPSAGIAANRLARQMAEAESVLNETAAADLAAAADFARIPLALLEPLAPARLNNALRHALRCQGLPVPSAAQLGELRRALGAGANATARVRWPGAEARVHRRTLYLLPPRLPVAAEPGRVDSERGCRVAEGELSLVPAEGYGIPDRWAREGLSVGWRAGGERFRPHGHRQHKALKQWFQEQGIVPWMRARVPLLYRNGELIAIADLELADDLPQSAADAPFWRPHWTRHSPLR